MKIRTTITATCATLAFSMGGPVSAHDSELEAVTKNLGAAIRNIPGRSLLAMEVDYARGAGRGRVEGERRRDAHLPAR